MNVTKKNLEKSEVEILVELSLEEFKPYIDKGTAKVSQEVKIEGFRPGKVPFDILKQKIGEMTILEEAARIAINKTIDQAIKENMGEQEPVGQPRVDITKLAPGNALEYKVVIAILPSLEIADYKNAKIKPEKVEVKNEEVEKMIAQLQEAGVTEVIVDREIKKGDKALVDVKMFLDKIPVEGGQGNGVGVVIGDEHVVPGFDKQITGAKKGDTREFSLPYPEQHHMKNLAGKMVEFEVTIKDVYERQLPEANDELASKFGLKSIEELRANIKKSIESEKKEQARQKEESGIIEKIADNSKFGDIPEVLIENESRMMLGEIEENIKRQGGKFEDYLASTNKTRDQVILELLPNAIKRVKAALLIREIARQENIKVSEKEIDEKVESLVKRYKGYEKVEARVKDPSYRSYLESTMINEKVIDKLREWNIEKNEVSKKKEDNK